MNVLHLMLPYRVEYEHRKDGTTSFYTIDVISSGLQKSCMLDGNECVNGIIELTADGKKHKIVVDINTD